VLRYIIVVASFAITSRPY